MPYTVEEVEQRFKDEDGRMYGAAYCWMIAEIKRLQTVEDGLMNKIDAIAHDTAKDVAARCAVIAEADIGHNHPTACAETCNIVADKIRTEYGLPKAG